MVVLLVVVTNSPSFFCQGLGSNRVLQVLQRCVLKSALGVIKTIETGAYVVKTIYMILMFTQRWRRAAAWSTLDGLKWRGWRNRCREEVPFENWAGEEAMKEDRVLGQFLVQSWSPVSRVGVSEETFWVDVYKAVLDFVEHPQADLLPSVFKTCPLQVFCLAKILGDVQ